ncbi:MAG TPA: gluconate 2-dehydrogenase subunit 3 family protein [Actinomycetota bacterium]
MPEEDSLAKLRAAIEAIAPPVDGQLGGVELGVEHHVVEQIELFLPGMTDMIGSLLDAFAMDVRPGAAFTDLTLQERGEVFRAMASEESQDLREAIDAVFVFTLGGVYSETPGAPDERPASWDRVGFGGPSDGHPDYREGA